MWFMISSAEHYRLYRLPVFMRTSTLTAPSDVDNDKVNDSVSITKMLIGGRIRSERKHFFPAHRGDRSLNAQYDMRNKAGQPSILHG